MKLKITIEMDNAAFCDENGDPSQGPEVARILGRISNAVNDISNLEEFRYRLLDLNGNHVGEAKVVR